MHLENPSEPGIRLLVPASEAARMLSIGRSTFWREVKAKRLPEPVKIGGATRWRVTDIEAFVARLAPQGESLPTPVAVPHPVPTDPASGQDATFLSRREVAQLTGLSRSRDGMSLSALQVEALHKMAVPHRVNAIGRVMVARDAIVQGITAQAPKPRGRGVNLDLVR